MTNFNPALEENLHKVLKDILTATQLSLSAAVQDKIIQYIKLLGKWNQAYNLTAVRDPIEMMTRHIADSLAVASYLTGKTIIDVGSGAGLPGIPLALVFPERKVVLLDSNGKKTRFLIQVKAELGLDNVEVVQSRAEDYQPEQCFDCIIARAFTQIGDMITKTRHLACKNGQIWAMKGVYPEDELKKVAEPYQVYPLQVPGLAEQRHLVCISL